MFVEWFCNCTSSHIRASGTFSCSEIDLIDKSNNTFYDNHREIRTTENAKIKRHVCKVGNGDLLGDSVRAVTGGRERGGNNLSTAAGAMSNIPLAKIK